MSDRGARWLTIAVVAVILLLLAMSAVLAQTPAQRGPALEHRLRDLHEHRDWLEDQLAASKAISEELRAQLTAATAELAKCRDAK